MGKESLLFFCSMMGIETSFLKWSCCFCCYVWLLERFFVFTHFTVVNLLTTSEESGCFCFAGDVEIRMDQW